MSKIAPTLAEFVDPNRKHLIEHKREKAREELKSVMAVVRSAALMAAEGRSPDRTMDDLKALRRALARLSRAGRGRGR